MTPPRQARDFLCVMLDLKHKKGRPSAYIRHGPVLFNIKVGTLTIGIAYYVATPETIKLRNEEETRQPDNPWAHFSDTDHAGNREIQNRRRSQNCYIACHRGMPVYWKSSVSSVAFTCAEIGGAAESSSQLRHAVG